MYNTHPMLMPMPVPVQPYTYVNGQSFHDAGKFYVKNAQNRDLANLVILDQVQNREYLAKVRYYTHNGINKFGLNFYVPPSRPIFITNPSVQVNTQSCTDKAAGGKKAIQDMIDKMKKEYNDADDAKKETMLKEKNEKDFLAGIDTFYQDDIKKIEDDEKKCIEALKQSVVQQNGAIVTDGRAFASNHGMLVPGMSPMIPVATGPRYVVAPYTSGVSYNLYPAVKVFHNDGLPRNLTR